MISFQGWKRKPDLNTVSGIPTLRRKPGPHIGILPTDQDTEQPSFWPRELVLTERASEPTRLPMAFMKWGRVPSFSALSERLAFVYDLIVHFLSQNVMLPQSGITTNLSKEINGFYNLSLWNEIHFTVVTWMTEYNAYPKDLRILIFND